MVQGRREDEYAMQLLERQIFRPLKWEGGNKFDGKWRLMPNAADYSEAYTVLFTQTENQHEIHMDSK